jgi:PAS domain-containing protein
MLTGPETDVTSMTALRDSMAAGRPSRVLLRNYRKDGQPFWNDLSVAPVLDHAGRLTHFVAIQSDVTDHVEASKSEATRALEATVLERTHEVEASLVALEERRRFAETILNSLASALLTTDSSRTVTFANLSALRTLGVSVAECVGRSVLEIFGHNEAVAEVVEGAVPPHPEHRLDFPLTTPGGSRVYIGLSIVRAPPELRDEIDLIFLFRNLAETVLEEDDPRLTGLGASTGVEAAEADLDGEAAASADPQSARRRLTLSLHYTQLAGLMQAVIDDLAAERGHDGALVALEAEGDVPEVLLDRRQVSEALRLLLRSLLERCDDPSEIRVRVCREAGEAGGGRTRPAACIELLWRRELITEGDLEAQAEATGRPPHRRADLAEAEKLIEANGGRLRRPLREAEEQSLTVLFPSAT